MIDASHPSRCQLLTSFIAGLFAWLLPKKIEAAVVEAPATPSVQTYCYDDGSTVEQLVSHTSYLYDAQGCCIRVQEHVDYAGGMTTYVYDGTGELLS